MNYFIMQIMNKNKILGKAKNNVFKSVIYAKRFKT